MKRELPAIGASENSSGTHLKSLDFLRVLALLGVFFYHLNDRGVPYGYLGVLGFFTLAGFLTMRGICIQNPQKRGFSQSLKGLGRKWLKLTRPLVVFLLVVGGLMILFFPAFLKHLGGQIRSALLWDNNWHQIIQGDSYFEGAGLLKPLVHLWALSLEMQVYALFALLVQPFYQPRHQKEWMGLWIVLTIVSLSLYQILYDPNQDPTRIYYGTDTRLFSFTTGALVATLPEKEIRWESFWQRVGRQILVSLFLLLIIVSFVAPMTSKEVIRWGLPLVSFLWAGVIFLVRDEDTYLTRIGTNRIIHWMTSRSYWIYLIHYAFFRMIERALAFNPVPIPLLMGLEISGAVFLSELFYQVFSVGIRMDADDRKRPSHFSGRPHKERTAASVSLVKPIQCVVLSLVLAVFPWTYLQERRAGRGLELMKQKILEAEKQQERQRQRTPDESQEDDTEKTTEPKPIQEPQNLDPQLITPSEKPGQMKNPRATSENGSPIRGEMREFPTQTDGAEQQWVMENAFQDMEEMQSLGEAFQWDSQIYERNRNLPLSLIGDSVSVIASYYMDPYLPSLVLDAKSNRQMGELWAEYSALKQENKIGEALVVGLGTNGDVDPEALEKVYQDLGGKPLFLITIVLPYSITEAERNEGIRSFAESHDQVWLVEWNKEAKSHPEYFQEDAIHPNEYGCKVFCHLLTAKIMSVLELYETEGRLIPAESEQ